MRALLPCGSQRTFSGFFREEEGDGNTQNTPRKPLQSERITDVTDSHSRMSCVCGETESEGRSFMSEPPSLPGLELFQPQVSTPHLESGVQILTPDPWIALPHLWPRPTIAEVQRSLRSWTCPSTNSRSPADSRGRTRQGVSKNTGSRYTSGFFFPSEFLML